MKDPELDWLTSAAAVIAGLFPLILKGIDLDGSIKNISECASQYTILKDRFRQAALIKADGAPEDLTAEFDALMNRLDEVRKVCPAIPERHFEKAKAKIKKNHYSFEIDRKREE